MSDGSERHTQDAVAYQFDGFRICVRQRVLAVNGEPIPIETRVFNVLTYLIAHRDRAVSKEELEEAVWQGRPLSETVLARSIMKARQALGDDPEQQNYIRTVRGFGYQFVGEVEVKDASQCEGRMSSRRKRVGALLGRLPAGRGLAVTVVALIALAGAGIGLGFTPWQSEAVSQSPPLRIAVEPVDNATDDASLDSTALRMTTILDRELTELPSLDVVTVSDGAMERQLGTIPKYCPVMRTKLQRSGAEYRLDYHVRSAVDTGISGRVSGNNPRELTAELVQRVQSATKAGELVHPTESGSE